MSSRRPCPWQQTLGITSPELSDRSSVQHLVQHLPANRGIYRSIKATHRSRGQGLGNNKTAGQTRFDLRFTLVARGGVEPPTFRFSVGRSYQLSYLALGEALHDAKWNGHE